MLGRTIKFFTRAATYTRIAQFSTPINPIVPSAPKPEKITYTIDFSKIKGTRSTEGGKYLIMYTCKVCNNKSARTFSKDAYQNGVVIIRCEHCKNYHLIADNLHWFSENKINIEDIIKERGEIVSKVMTNQCIEFIYDQNHDQKPSK
jgi:hypothetical protein